MSLAAAAASAARLAERLAEDASLARTREELVRVSARASEARALALLLTVLPEPVSGPESA